MGSVPLLLPDDPPWGSPGRRGARAVGEPGPWGSQGRGEARAVGEPGPWGSEGRGGGGRKAGLLPQNPHMGCVVCFLGKTVKGFFNSALHNPIHFFSNGSFSGGFPPPPPRHSWEIVVFYYYKLFYVRIDSLKCASYPFGQCPRAAHRYPGTHIHTDTPIRRGKTNKPPQKSGLPL